MSSAAPAIRVLPAPATAGPKATTLADPQRLAALRATGLYAPQPSAQLDLVARIAAAALDAPMAAIALIGADWLALPGCAGLPPSIDGPRQLPLGSNPCEEIVVGNCVLCISGTGDSRLPAWMADQGIAAQLGVPLNTASGHTVGSISVLDGQPHLWSERDEALLLDLAAMVTAELERSRETVEREVAELLLRHSERHFRSLIENAADMISLVDRSGVFRYVSPAYERCTGHPTAELIDQSVFAAIHPDDLDSALSAFATAVEHPGMPIQAQFRYRHRNGDWAMIASTATSLLDDPAVGGVVLNSRDVTDRVRLEAQLRHGQKMEAVGRMAGGIAHDFNNLLTVIEAHSQFALEAIEEGETVEEDLAAIRQATDRATGLTRQLLAFSRKQILQPQRLDLNRMLHGLTTMLGRLLGEDVVLATALTDAPCPVHADPGQLEQVVMNLAVNARDAMSDGGRITIATRRTTVSPAAASTRPGLSAGRYVALEVSDTGSGIDPLVLPHIFEPFFTTKAAGRGTGLGLATVYGVVKQSGGYVYVESTPSRGTSFTVLLPHDDAGAAPVVAGAVAGTLAAPLPRGTETVLLVEDEAEVRAVARRSLERQGYTVLEASDGAGAERIWLDAAGEVDMLLTDVVMPGMDGHVLSNRLRADRPDLRVLMVSGYDRAAGRVRIDASIAVLQKPFTPDDLARRVRQVLDG